MDESEPKYPPGFPRKRLQRLDNQIELRRARIDTLQTSLQHDPLTQRQARWRRAQIAQNEREIAEREQRARELIDDYERQAKNKGTFVPNQ